MLSNSPSLPTTNRRRVIAALLPVAAIVVLTQIAYAPLWRNDLVHYDDYVYVVDNPPVASGLDWESVKWAFRTDERTGNWHPLTWLSHMVDASIFGPEAPVAFHAVNLTLHSFSAALLFLLLWIATGQRIVSFAVAALFAVHPVNVESVAWAAQRKNVLSTLCWMLAMLAYTRFVGRRNWTPYLATALAMGAGLMSKATLVTLPFVLLLWDAWPLGRFRHQPARRLVLEKVPLLLLSVGACVVTYAAQAPARATAEALPISVRLANAILAYGVYLRKLVWPMDLAVLYPHPGATLLTPGGFVPVGLSAMLLVAVSLVVWRFGEQKGFLRTGWCWYLGTLVPVIGLVHVGLQGWADRYVYVPAIGIFIATCWSLSDFAKRRAVQPFLAILAMSVVVSLMVLTWRQLETWRDSKSLFEQAIAVTPSNPGAHANLGFLLARDGEFQRAADHMRRALEDDPNNPDYHVQLAKILAQLGEDGDALRHYDEAISLSPQLLDAHKDRGLLRLNSGDFAGAYDDFSAALRGQSHDAELLAMRGVAAAQLGEFEEAIQSLQRSLAIENDEKTRHVLVTVCLMHADHLLGSGRLQAAVDGYRLAVELSPERGDANRKLAEALLAVGAPNEAAEYARKAHRLLDDSGRTLVTLARCDLALNDPSAAVERLEAALMEDADNIEAGNLLAWTLATHPDAEIRDGRRAASLAARVCELTNYQDASLMATWAAALAESGNFLEAERRSEQAAKLARAAGDEEAAERFAARTGLYAAGRPFRDRGDSGR